jgi:hypothetical protein
VTKKRFTRFDKPESVGFIGKTIERIPEDLSIAAQDP